MSGSPLPEEQRVQLYGHDGSAKQRILTDEAGALYTVDQSGIRVPQHDKQVIDETDPNEVTITYSLNAVDVAVKTISVSGSVTTITMNYL